MRWSPRQPPHTTRPLPTATAPKLTSSRPGAELEVAQADERDARVLVEYGKIKAPYDGVITQRNVSPGDYLQPGAGSGGRPLFVLEQTDPVRVFVGVPELASFFIHDNDTATIRLQAIPGATREGKVVRSGFSLDPSTRTLQTEIDIPNSDDHLHPGWYVTVTHRDRAQAGLDASLRCDRLRRDSRTTSSTSRSTASRSALRSSSARPTTRTPKCSRSISTAANTNDWPEFDGTERVLTGNLEILAASTRPTTKAAGDNKSGR